MPSKMLSYVIKYSYLKYKILLLVSLNSILLEYTLALTCIIGLQLCCYSLHGSNIKLYMYNSLLASQLYSVRMQVRNTCRQCVALFVISQLKPACICVNYCTQQISTMMSDCQPILIFPLIDNRGNDIIKLYGS